MDAKRIKISKEQVLMLQNFELQCALLKSEIEIKQKEFITKQLEYMNYTTELIPDKKISIKRFDLNNCIVEYTEQKA